jgi:pimeloyl-ACP methyl ester carboxylesterase
VTHSMILRHAIVRVLAVASLAFTQLSPAQTAPSPAIGVVVMHGKGGLPTGFVAGLASFLEQKGYLVANLEMPWSGRRQYDVPVDAAETEVQAALDAMRAKGAGKVFVAGHSQGGVFALHYGGQRPADGVIAIAPGGNVGNALFRKEVGPALEQARKLVAEGKGSEKARLSDHEGSRGSFTVVSPPAAYLTWFDPEGAMNQVKASRAVNPQVPVLFVGPKNDYAGLARIKPMMFGALPRHPLTRMIEPDASHTDAPTVAREEIARWIEEVAAAPTRKQ